MAAIQGAVGSNNYATNARFIDGEGKIYFNPKRMDTPLISFLGMNGRTSSELVGEATGGTTKISGQALSKRQVFNAQYDIFTDEVLENATQINFAAGYTSADVSIVVDDGSLFTANDTVLVPRTGEVFIVSARSGNTLTIVRGVGSTAAALADNDYIARIASAFAVNSLSGTAKSTQVARDYNYTQIFRTAIQIGRTDKDSKLNYSPKSDETRLLSEGALEHLRSIERAFWYGTRAELAAIDSSGARQRTTGGIFQFITQNVMDISASGGTLTAPIMDAFAEMVFDKGSKTKLLFCSPRFLSKLNGLALNLIRITPKESAFGLDLMKYVTSHGEFILVRTPHFGDLGFGVKYIGTAVCIDPDQIKYAYLNQAENELRMNIQENDRDGVKHEYLAECGLMLANQTAHGIIQGVAA
jgi:hypothetical protein